MYRSPPTDVKQRAPVPAPRRSFLPAAPSPSTAIQDVRGRFRFVRDIAGELKKVVWPTREETSKLTVIVVIVSVAVGLFLGAIDYVFYAVVNQVILGR